MMIPQIMMKLIAVNKIVSGNGLIKCFPSMTKTHVRIAIGMNVKTNESI